MRALLATLPLTLTLTLAPACDEPGAPTPDGGVATPSKPDAPDDDLIEPIDKPLPRCLDGAEVEVDGALSDLTIPFADIRRAVTRVYRVEDELGEALSFTVTGLDFLVLGRGVALELPLLREGEEPWPMITLRCL